MGKKAEKAVRDRAEVLRVLDPLGREALVEIERRGRYAVSDGYPAQSMGTGAGSIGGHSDPTAAKAISERAEHDEIASVCEQIWSKIGRIASDAQDIEKSVAYLRHVHETAKGRQTTISFCQACSKEMSGAYNDRPRSGYCQRCYARWCRLGRPDRVQFERDIKNDVTTVSTTTVTACANNRDEVG